jgi:hypothetical protein
VFVQKASQRPFEAIVMAVMRNRWTVREERVKAGYLRERRSM